MIWCQVPLTVILGYMQSRKASEPWVRHTSDHKKMLHRVIELPADLPDQNKSGRMLIACSQGRACDDHYTSSHHPQF